MASFKSASEQHSIVDYMLYDYYNTDYEGKKQI